MKLEVIVIKGNKPCGSELLIRSRGKELYRGKTLECNGHCLVWTGLDAGDELGEMVTSVVNDTLKRYAACKNCG